MAEGTLRKAKEKVTEKEEAIEALDRGVQWMQRELAAVVERVKEEEVDEVVEVDVEVEEMEEGIVKEEVEEKVVVETPAGGGGVSQWLRGNDGVEGCGGPPGSAMGHGCPGWPPHPKPGDTPPRCPGESGLDSPVFVGAGAPPAVGGGAVGGVVNGSGGWQRELPGPRK